jgi:hypothetical protein
MKMPEQETDTPPQTNLLGGLLLIASGASIMADGDFSHPMIGVMSGGTVRVGAALALAMGTYFVVRGYMLRVSNYLKYTKALLAILITTLLGLVSLPFLREYGGIRIHPLVQLTVMFMPFIIGNTLHRKLTSIREANRRIDTYK